MYDADSRRRSDGSNATSARGRNWHMDHCFFCLPLLFECHEAFAVSDTFFGYQHRVYPEAIPWREPDPAGPTAIVLESDSPFRAAVERRFQLADVVPLISEYGKLSEIEGNRR